MRYPPAPADAKTARPFSSARSTGTAKIGILPGAIELGRPGRGSKLPMPLLRMMPVPGTAISEPKLPETLVQSAAMLPSPSAASIDRRHRPRERAVEAQHRRAPRAQRGIGERRCGTGADEIGIPVLRDVVDESRRQRFRHQVPELQCIRTQRREVELLEDVEHFVSHGIAARDVVETAIAPRLLAQDARPV